MKRIPNKFKELEAKLRELNWKVTLKGREILKKFNSSSSQLQCLSVLYFCKQDNKIDEMTMGEMAKKIDLSLSTATGIMDRLVKNGLVDRYRSGTDRRKVLISLSPKGETLIKEIIMIRQSYLMSICRNIPSDEVDEFISTLNHFSELMKEGKPL